MHSSADPSTAAHAEPPSGQPVAVVTGAGSGIGLALTQQLLADGWRVLACVRTVPAVAADAPLAAARRTGALRWHEADLAEAADRTRLVAAIRHEEARIDVLFNNAGVSPDRARTSPQHRELCHEVNAVAPYVLARGLAPLLAAGRTRRIVNTSSNAALTVRDFDPSRPVPTDRYRKLFGACAQSKLALSLWTAAVADELRADGISIVSVCPGANQTPMTRGPGMPWALKWVARILFKPPSWGAAQLVTARDSTAPSGSFLVKGKPVPIPFLEHANDVLREVEAAHHSDALRGLVVNAGNA